MATRAKILHMLQAEQLTIAALATKLNVTRNAVAVQLRQLHADGLTEAVKVHRTGQAGKPALLYAATTNNEDHLSSAYKPFATELVNLLESHMDDEDRSKLYQEVGAGIARRAELDANGAVSGRVAKAKDYADQLGFACQLKETGEGTLVTSHTCMLGTAARADQCICLVVRSFFGAATGCLVEQRCDQGKRLTCRFMIKTSPPHRPN